MHFAGVSSVQLPFDSCNRSPVLAQQVGLLHPSASVCNYSAMLLQKRTYNRSHNAHSPLEDFIEAMGPAEVLLSREQYIPFEGQQMGLLWPSAIARIAPCFCCLAMAGISSTMCLASPAVRHAPGREMTALATLALKRPILATSRPDRKP